LLEHDLFRKPVTTFRDHALSGRGFHDPQLVASRPDSASARQRDDAFAIDRLAEVIALRVLGTGGDEKRCLRVGSTPFGVAVDVELVGEAGRRRRTARRVNCMPREISSERMKVIVCSGWSEMRRGGDPR
jgi:hypothetical protein